MGTAPVSTANPIASAGQPIMGPVRWLAASLCLAAGPLQAQVAATPQRPSFTTDASITSRGTVELELGGAAFDGAFSLPTTVKLTPDLDGGPLANLEWSLSFDSLVRESSGTGRHTASFGDRVTLAGRRPIYGRNGLALAVAPQVTFFRRGTDGVRAGALAIAVQQLGKYSLVGNLAWTAATQASDGNPAHQLDWAAGLSRSLGRASLFAEALLEDPSGAGGTVSLMQGVVVSLRPDLVLDFAVQQSAVNGETDIGALIGMTLNFGRW